MKHILKKKVFNYKPKPFYDAFDPLGPKYRKNTKGDGNQRDEHRLARRMRKTNQYDPEVTEEKSVPGITQDKAKTIYKFFNEYKNIHRFSRKPIPKEEMDEYIKKAKEYSDFRTYEEYKHHMATTAFLKNKFESMRSAFYLPTYLMAEIGNPLRYEEGYKYEDSPDDEEKFSIVDYEFNCYYLYLDQIMRMLPDDYQINLKTMVNYSAYDKPTGERDEDEIAHVKEIKYIKGLDGESSGEEF